MPHGLNVVLVEPEIPQNTGSIGRLCLGVGAKLHLIEPLGFELSHSRLKRAGLDYWQHLDVKVHKNLETFLRSIPADAPRVMFTKKAGRPIFEHEFEPGSYLFFGQETFGLPEDFLSETINDGCPKIPLRIPIYDARVRSLNLANSVSVAVYEAIRQLGH